MCGEGYAPQLAYNQAMGFALGSGSALKLLGRRPNEGHSPKISKAFSARRSLRRTSGGEAAQPHAFCKVAALILIALLWTTATAQQDDRYRIGPSDVLDVRIHNRPQISREAVRVEGNGMIRMPLIESEIQAACLTEGELAKAIAQGYLKFYRNPQVDVFIKAYHSRQVAIIGAVIEPARFEMKQRYRLLDLLTYARGPSDKAGQVINIVRGPKLALCEKDSSAPEEISDSLVTLKLSETMSGVERA